MIPSVFKISTLVLFVFVQSSLCIDVKLLKESVPVAVGVMLEADKSVVSEKCFEDIQVILQGIADRHLWALQILDSSGNRQSAFLWGDNYWIGYRQSCITSNKPTPEEVAKRLPHEVLDIPSPVTVDYRILTGLINFEEQKVIKMDFLDSKHFHFGICIPTSCSFNETNYISQKYFGKGLMSSFFKATIVNIVGVAGVTFVISVICTAAVEIPFQNLTKLSSPAVSLIRSYFNVLFLFVQSSLCIDVKLLQENVPVAVGVMLEADKSVLSEKCFEDIQVILQGISDRHLWALQILDSSGNRPSAFLWGDNFWIGYRQSCITSNKPTPKEMTKRLPHEVLDIPSPVTVDYRILTGLIKFEEQKVLKMDFMNSKDFHFGICIPTSCSFNDTNNISQKYFGKGLMSSFFKATVNFKRIQDFNQTTADLWSNFSYQAFVLLIVTLTILSLLSRRNATLRSCFHFPSNLLATLATKTKPHPDSIPSLTTFRSCFCLWIVGAHMTMYNFSLQRTPLHDDLFYRIHYMVFYRAFTATDIFSMSSGLLLAYIFLNNIKLQAKIKENTFVNNCKLYLSLILHRYLRLAPVMLVSIIVSRMAYLYLDSINSQLGGCPGIQCHNWIYNMVFAQNLLPVKEMCQIHSWQISSDFHLFGIFLMILFVHAKNPRLGRSIVIFVTAGGVLLTFIFCIHYEFKVTVLGVFNSLDTVYTKLWCHFHPFGVGVIIGMFLKRVKDTKVPNFNRRIVQLYIISTLALLGVICWTAGDSTNIIISAFIWSVVRFTYSIILGSYICLAHWGYLNKLTDLGASSFCQRVCKISYPFYLLHGVMSKLAFGGRIPPSDLSFPMTIVNIVGVAGVTFVISVICTAAVEIPFQNLTKLYFKKHESSKQVTEDKTSKLL
ncbi:hypothetical protein DMENIID0001_013360 [Sergentomyia squamirostris]